MQLQFSVNKQLNERYIISSCVINKTAVIKNGQQIFSSEINSIQTFLSSLYNHLKTDYPKFYKMDHLSKLGFLASEILLSNVNMSDFDKSKISIVLSNANSSLDTDFKYYQSIKEFASPGLFVYTLPNIVTGEISIRNKFKGENAFFVSEKFSADIICLYVNNLFDTHKTDLCICGWTDVLEENYKAVLYLVSTKQQQDVLLFNEENLNRIFAD